MGLNTVLLVEDDRDFRQMVREQLENHDFLVLEAAAGRRSLQILEQQPVDIILLDLHLLDGNGLDFIIDIKKRSNAPVIIVSGAGNPMKTVESLDKGADDFVQKPFEMDVLLARMRANLRRHHASATNQNERPENANSGDKIQFGDWTLDETQFQIFDCENVSGGLTAKEFRLLQKLAENGGKVVSREDLCEAIREANYVPTKRAIDVKITRIRKKIRDNAAAPSVIRTIRGVGYMLNVKTGS